MQNKKFLFTSMVLAVVANIAIIGCNRQGSGDAHAADTADIPAAHAESESGQEAVPTPQAVPPELNEHAQASTASQKNPYENAKIEITTFQVDAPATGYGYDIIIDGVRRYHQYNIPGVPGINGFSSEMKARKAGEFVASKVRRNIVPPAVDAKELDSLGVLK